MKKNLGFIFMSSLYSENIPWKVERNNKYISQSGKKTKRKRKKETHADKIQSQGKHFSNANNNNLKENQRNYKARDSVLKYNFRYSSRKYIFTVLPHKLAIAQENGEAYLTLRSHVVVDTQKTLIYDKCLFCF